MAINKKLIHFKTFENFNSHKLSANEENTKYTLGADGEVLDGTPDILYQSIVWIKDAQKQWTHGQLYGGGGNSVGTAILEFNTDGSALSAEQKAHNAEIYNKMMAGDKLAVYVDIGGLISLTRDASLGQDGISFYGISLLNRVTTFVITVVLKNTGEIFYSYYNIDRTIDTELSDTSENAVQNKVITDALANKVDKVTGKGLSTNDYTTTEKNKLAGIAEGAEVNVQSDWNATSGDAYIKNKPSLATVATSGSYNDLSNKPIIPIETIVDTSISSTSTNPVQNKVVKEYIDNAVVTPVESVTSTSKSIEPNKYYKWTSAMSSLTITLATPTNTSILNNYMFEFTTSSSGCTLNVPSMVKWANSEAPTIEASKTYQVSIINNLAVVSNF